MSSSETSSSRYQHFILQLRQEVMPTGKAPVWRLTLEDPHSGERKGFRTVEDLAAFLNEWMNSQTIKE
ncbi:MAG: hypothetical protein Fur0022_04220 [Anaerolineales bacterium]